MEILLLDCKDSMNWAVPKFCFPNFCMQLSTVGREFSFSKIEIGRDESFNKISATVQKYHTFLEQY